MSPWRFLGWTLLVAAFVAAAAERAALSLAQDWGVMAASDVLRVLYPRTLESLQNAMAPFAWNYIVLPVLALVLVPVVPVVPLPVAAVVVPMLLFHNKSQ